MGGAGGVYQHSVETPVRRPSPGAQSRWPRLAGARLALSSSCMAESTTLGGGVGGHCQHWQPPLILGARPPEGPVQGQGEGVGPALGSSPCLTSMVSASPAALCPLMAATRCSSRRPCSSLPVMSSHRADSTSHLGREGGQTGRVPACHPRAWLQWVAQGPASTSLTDPLTLCPTGWPHWCPQALDSGGEVCGRAGRALTCGSHTISAAGLPRRPSSLPPPSSLHWIEVGGPCSPLLPPS